MNQHIFFHQFGMPGMQPQLEVDPNYLYNTMIFEIATNWSFVRWLMCQYRENTLVNIDPIEHDWLQFIISNKIDVEKYQKDVNLFLDENLKQLV